MNYNFPLDQSLFTALNGFAGSSMLLDDMIGVISRNYMAKGLVPVLLIWGLWFSPSADLLRQRTRLVAAVVLTIFAILLGRATALQLPFRARPLHDPDVVTRLPLGLDPGTLDGWSSFPSDHAVMYFSMAAVLFTVRRWAGVVALIHALIVISLPRIYLGVHYPSDILFGAVIGVLCAWLLVPVIERAVGAVHLMTWEARWPQTFYPVMFFVTFQAATMFASLRQLLAVVAALAQKLV